MICEFCMQEVKAKTIGDLVMRSCACGYVKEFGIANCQENIIPEKKSQRIQNKMVSKLQPEFAKKTLPEKQRLLEEIALETCCKKLDDRQWYEYTSIIMKNYSKPVYVSIRQ